MPRRTQTIECVGIDDLTAEDRAAWVRLRAASPALASPYFDLRYVEAAFREAPNPGLAVLRRGGEATGFFAFQRRRGLIQPLGAPVCDYHGLIAAPHETRGLKHVLRAAGAARFRFSGLVSSAPPPRAAARAAMAAILDGGYDAWAERRRDAGRGGFLKDKRRRLARLEREHGPVAFEFLDRSDEVLDHIVAGKRAQLRRTGQHDIFDCGWTERLLRRLADSGAPDFGLRLAVLRAGGRIVAAEAGLTSGAVHHLWFPVYDPAFAAYSPGALMTLATLRVCAERGVRLVDFGPGGEPYKADFAEPWAAVYEGTVNAEGLAFAGPAAAVRRRLARRLDRIAACEPGLPGQALALSRYAGVMARRHPRLSLAAGLGLGLGVGAGLIAD